MGLFIDKISGQVFLFDISVSGGTGSGSTSAYPQVNTFSQLPSAASNNGKIYVVLQTTGTYPHIQEAGLYYSNGTTWSRIGDTTAFFSSANFRIYDSVDTTKQVRVVLSGNTSGTTRVLTLRNSNGTIAYLSDLTGVTSTQSHAIQLIDLIGGININSISPIPILWTHVEFTGTSINYTGASKIYIQTTGNYQISYNLVAINKDINSKTIGGVIRLNGTTDITPMSFASYIDAGSSVTGSNNVANYKKSLNAGDYLELYVFRVGNSGTALTVPSCSWIHVIKI